MKRPETIKEHVPASFLSGLLAVSTRSVNRRAFIESWPSVRRRTRGGNRKLYIFNRLPEDIRTAAIAKSKKTSLPAGAFAAAGSECGFAYEAEAKKSAALKRKSREAGMIKYLELSAEKQKTAEARLKILKARDAFVAGTSLSVKRATKAFCREITAGRLPLPDDVKTVLSKGAHTGAPLRISWQTLNRWRAAYEAQGLYGLAPKYKTLAETPIDVVSSAITGSMQEFIVAMKVDKPHVTCPKIMKGLAARFDGQQIPHPATVRRFLSRWEAVNKSILLYCANPDEWKNRNLFAVGSADEAIERLNQMWEMDSTPGDVMLIDGRHTLIGCIDIYSRRLKLLVSKTSNSAGIAALIRNCLLDWGVPEAIKTDNGTDYVSNHIVRVLSGLEIEQRLCRHFSPEEKPFIERALGTFSHDIVELLPGYVGHSVADRKAIESRRSFAQRLMKQGEVVDVNMTASALQTICDRWVNAMYHQDPHAGIDGKTPAQVAREWTQHIRRIENPRALDLLLYPAPDSEGYRVIGKKGIAVNGLNYSAIEFAGHEGSRVRVLVDPSDLGAVYCYLESGDFLCKAIEPGLAGVDRAEHAARVKAVQKQVMNAARAELKKVAQKAAVSTVFSEILAHREGRIANISEFPPRSTPYTTDALDEAARAVSDIQRKTSGPSPIEITAEEEAGANEVISLATRRPGTPLFSNDWEKYEFYNAAFLSGTDMADETLAWMKRFEVRLASEESQHNR